MAKINPSVMSLVRKFLAGVYRNGIRIEAAYLYGSHAKGKENNWSDIDIAIVSPDITGNRFQERIRFMKLSSTIDSRIEPVPFRPEAFVDEDPLVWEIKKEGIPIKHTSNYGKKL